MSEHIGDPGHGHSPAAWTTVVIMLLGLALGTFFFFLEIPWLVWASVGVVVAGVVVGWIMAKAGYGVGGAKVAPHER